MEQPGADVSERRAHKTYANQSEKGSGGLFHLLLADLYTDAGGGVATRARPLLQPLTRDNPAYSAYQPNSSLYPMVRIGELPKIIVIVLASIFPVLLNTESGIFGCDKGLVEVGRILGFSKSRIF